MQMQTILDTVFSPFDRLNLETLYTKYHVGIDFILYAFVLVYACRLSLNRIYPNGQGKNLGTVVGIVLAVSLGASEQTLGFSARSFGPIAAGIVI